MSAAVSALLLLGPTVAGPADATANRGGRQDESVAAYSAIPPGALPGNIPAVGFQALRISEVGDYVGLATTAELTSMRVGLSVHACEDRPPPDGRCLTTPGATFPVPITARIYAVNETTDPVSVGALITSATITFNIPFRPSSDCPDNTDRWFSAADNQCYIGLLHVIEFPASAFSSTGPLPQRVIWTVAYNTEDSGYQPTGVPGPYNALNVGAFSFDSDLAAFAGTDEQPNAAFLYSSRDSTYCDGGLAGVDVLRDDVPPPDDPTRLCWLGFRPVGEINVVRAASTVGLTATPLNPQPTKPVTLTATVTCNVGTPTGTVTYLDDGTTLGTATLSGDPATATLTLPSLAPGTHTIRARYNGNTDCPATTSNPVTVTVAQPASAVRLTISPQHPRPNEPVTLIATVTCNAGTPTGTVTYLDNGTTLGTATLTGDPATATLTLESLTPGTHTIRAHYNGNTDCPAATSEPVTVTVRPVLPVTGANLPTTISTGILLLLGGGLLVITTRRRRT